MPDDRPRFAHPPIVEDSEGMPERWPGAPPRFPITVEFYVAVMRAELAHLARYSRMYLELTDESITPDEPTITVQALAREIHYCVIGLREYRKAWAHVLDGIASWGRSTILAGDWCLRGFCPSRYLGQDLRVEEIAKRVATPKLINECEALLKLWPKIELDFSLPPTELGPPITMAVGADGRPADLHVAPGSPDEDEVDAWCDRITLDQAAALVHKSKRTLERLKTKGELPPPSIEGGGGRADYWDWPAIRPVLMAQFHIRLPENCPGGRR